MDSTLSGKKICIVVENLPVPFDRRVWQEAVSLHEAGAEVSVICPKTKNYPESELLLEGIRVFRHPLKEAERVWEYPFEYFFALFHEFRLLLKIF